MELELVRNNAVTRIQEALDLRQRLRNSSTDNLGDT